MTVDRRLDLSAEVCHRNQADRKCQSRGYIMTSSVSRVLERKYRRIRLRQMQNVELEKLKQLVPTLRRQMSRTHRNVIYDCSTISRVCVYTLLINECVSYISMLQFQPNSSHNLLL